MWRALILFVSPFFTLIESRNGLSPEQIHISYGDDPGSSMWVTWSTQEEATTAMVSYGEEELTNLKIGFTREFVDGGEEKRKQYVHRVLLTSLRPDTRYVYKCGSTDGWSSQYYFKTANSSESWAPTIAVYGDMGAKNARVFPVIEADVRNNRYDFVFHVGDFAYNMLDDNGRVGDEFMRMIEPVAAYVPYMVCPGNHEEAYNFSHYRERFTMPGQAESLYYSFNIGSAHIISIDTEAYYFLKYGDSLLKNQYAWLVNELKEANKPENRQRRPWIIVMGHKPMYCSNLWIDDCSDLRCKTRVGLKTNDGWTQYGLEELFYNSGVDLLLWGHEHSYERLWPTYDYQVKNGSYKNPYTNPRAPVHITTGAAGSKYPEAEFSYYKPPWSAMRTTEYSYTTLEIKNKTHLHIQQISVAKGGRPVDDIWIIKNRRGPNRSTFMESS